MTLASTAATLRDDLQAGVDEIDMLRVIIGAADDFSRLVSPEDQWFFLAWPAATTSAEWDALLAALAVHLCRQARLDRTPTWTRHPSRYLDRTWWVGAAGEVRAWLITTIAWQEDRRARPFAELLTIAELSTQSPAHVQPTGRVHAEVARVEQRVHIGAQQ